jgi:C-terminal processing protease CtpA/Prc
MRVRTMGPTLSAVLLVCLASTGGAAGLRNPSFEDGAVGKVPPGWFFPPMIRQAGFRAEITRDDPHSGKACARLHHDGQGAGRGMANILQMIDATPYRGKRVRLGAAIRIRGAGVWAQMWMRVDRKGNARGFFDNMGDRPVTSYRWKKVEIVGDVDGDAVQIAIGLMYTGMGAVYFDSVSLEVMGEALPPYVPEAARPLDRRGLTNLTAFARLFGCVRHFHPSDEAVAADWNTLALAGVRAIEDAKDSRELAKRLEAFFRPVAPTIRVFARGSRPTPHAALSPKKGLVTTGWLHRGFGQGQPQGIYSSKLTDTASGGGPGPLAIHEADLGGGVTALVPVALFRDERRTLPHSTGEKVASGLPENHVASGNDRATRLGAVVLAWNVFQHFYPYFDIVKTDWPAVLDSALTSAATDRDAGAFLGTLRRLVAALHDGHGYVSHQSDGAYLLLPIAWTWIDGRLVVTKAGGSGPRPGDVVLSIAGTPIETLMAQARSEISGATDQWVRYRALTRLKRVPASGPVKLEILSFAKKDEKVEVTLTPGSVAAIPREPRGEKIAEVAPGIWYLDLDRITAGEFEQSLPDLVEAKGIVFDMRGYPKGLNAHALFGRLIEKPVRSAHFIVPEITRPDRTDMNFDGVGRWTIPPLEPYLKAKRVFITDGRAISYAESCMGIVEAEKLGEIVGGPTAGTNGNVNPFTVPGGYRIMWTGMRVVKHDGSPHHGVGILPTIPTSRTRAGVAAGRDELLEKAIETAR